MFYKKLAKLLLASGLMLTVAFGGKTIEAKAAKPIATVDYADLVLNLTTTKEDKDANYFYVGVKTTSDVKVWDRIKAVPAYDMVPVMGEGIELKDGKLLYTVGCTVNGNDYEIGDEAEATTLTINSESVNAWLDSKGNNINKDGQKVNINNELLLEFGIVGKQVAVDISNYVSPTKAYTIEFYSDADTTSSGKDSVKLANQSKKIKAAYKDGKVTVEADKALSDTEFEFKPLYAESWNSGENLLSKESCFYEEYGMTMLDYYSLYGTTLLVREKVEYKYEPLKDSSGKPVTDENGNTVMEPTDSIKMMSKEAKLKIPKKANGPKLNMDVSKLTVTLPANTEWRIVNKAGNVLTTDWTKESAKKVLSIAGMKEKLSADYSTTNLLDGTVFLEAKTSAKGKKAESKISYFNIPQQVTGPVIGTDVKLEYVKGKKEDSGIETVKVTNASQKAIQILIGTEKDKVDITAATTKFATIKAGATKTYKKAQLGDKANVVVRFAGEKATKQNNMKTTLASELTGFTTKYPAAPSKFEATLAKGILKGEVYVTIPSKDPDLKYTYKIVNEKVDSLDIDTKSTGEPLVESTLNDKLSAMGAEKDKYLMIYESGADDIVTRFSCTQIAEAMVQTADPTEITITSKMSLTSFDSDTGEIVMSGFTKSNIYKYKIVSGKESKIYAGQIDETVLTDVTLNNTNSTITEESAKVGDFLLICHYTDEAIDECYYVEITE